MRAHVPGLGTPYPMAGLLPAVLQEDPVTTGLTEALDAVLAPVVGVLDCLDCYVDPQLAPSDFLDWLAGWVGARVDPSWPDARRRATVAGAVALYRSRGTVEGLRAQVQAATGGRVEIVDTGGVTWSLSPDGDPAPDGPAEVLVRVTGADPGAADADVVSALVAAAKPAHVTHRVELRG